MMQVDDVMSCWQTGVKLMQLVVALYKENEKHPEMEVRMPKLKPLELNPKSRIQEVTNCNTAIALMKQAGVEIRGLAAENLVDHMARDKPTILGMVYQIILDYAARGFGGSANEVKRALLEWVNKKTEGYERVNPPGVTNFTSNWTNGLAWCALIHKHRPDLLDFQACLGKSDEENLEIAFSVADEALGIPRLLDVEDMATPDEKSVVTYTMEYFLRFASESLKESAAKQAAEWLNFLRNLKEREYDYERRARALLAWVKESQASWDNYAFGETKEEAVAAFNELRNFVTSAKPPQEGEKMDLEALYAEIQTIRKINGLTPYKAPEDVLPEEIEKAFSELVASQSAHGIKVRENRFRFIEKKEETSSEEIVQQIETSFKHYDKNNNGSLQKTEFLAACMEVGIALKTDEEKDALFNEVSNNSEHVTFDQYKSWMQKRMVVSLDDPESIKNAFKTLADGSSGLSEAQLGQHLSGENKDFLLQSMPKNEAGLFDYSAFVSDLME